ncbi:uncharacterized protein HMPREF1541_08669 [Cyphellophora europaea CBS 101466]|uniref:STAS domain-containing protein n=1 Tax=Cyphellophora europaea (strain CBS 101466) TaxID=1220924 RepID=W2RIU2_CYPE1|nr:uncharacterized protein HMPREF1541_08669 [Cyphellophora europaea CBS 101466]ETN36392.1 hypothetical protein HMPREF1541_08669 [Cyphellophora europaea CBS 101466]
MGFTNFNQKLAKKVFGIDTCNQQHRRLKEFEEPLTQIVPHAYREQEPTVAEWFRSLVPDKHAAVDYIHDLFPSAQWVTRYNLRWLAGDSIAGLTIGLVIVPQAMAYALLAQLSPEYGLYTSLAGAATYWIFGTSKDIVIGTTAVGSLLVGQVITHVEEQRPGDYTRTEIAKALSFLIGAILLLIGLLRLGWLIEFIPYVTRHRLTKTYRPISAFVTAASITIMCTQIPVCLGIKGINTRLSPYRVILDTLEGLPRTQLDAAIGISCIVLLFVVRDVCAKLEVKRPAQKRMWATISSLRLSLAMIFFTLISWIVHRTMPRGETKFRLVGPISSGFPQAGPPRLDSDLVSLILPETPAILIILVIEHIAIAKAMGRTFSYTVRPSQEILAQGTANFLGPFVGGYCCTGSFGASAVLSKAGVRTPLAGLFSAMILILALYALTAVFYYIPMAALAGLIIHATSNLMTPPKSLYRYWQLSPFELIIWIAGVLLALFTSLETSIYVTIALSLTLLMVRLARTKGKFMGRVRIGRVAINVSVNNDDHKSTSTSSAVDIPLRDAYLATDRTDATNPDSDIETPYPGVFIFRFSEGFNYVNQAQQMDTLLRHILANTKCTSPDEGMRPSDRLWNDPGPTRASLAADAHKPVLRAVVLDCSSVNNTDITSVQGLIDTRNFLDRHASPAIVEWHFACVSNRWTRRALAVAGFGFPVADKPDAVANWAPVYTVSRSFAGATPDDVREEASRRRREKTRLDVAVDEERRCQMPVTKAEFEMQCEPIGEVPGDSSSDGEAASSRPRTRNGTASEVEKCSEQGEEEEEAEEVKRARRRRADRSQSPPVLLYGMDRPFFHVDLVEAVDAAVRDAKRAEGRGPVVVVDDGVVN